MRFDLLEEFSVCLPGRLYRPVRPCAQAEDALPEHATPPRKNGAHLRLLGILFSSLSRLRPASLSTSATATPSNQ